MAENCLQNCVEFFFFTYHYDVKKKRISFLFEQKVSQTEAKPSPVPDSRNDLLDQIRRGIELKPVTTKTKSTSLTEPQGLAGALSRALAERSRALGNDSQDSSSGTSEDDDDWDD